MANSIRHTIANDAQRQHHASYGSHYTSAPSFYDQETQFSVANNVNVTTAQSFHQEMQFSTANNVNGASLLSPYGSPMMAAHGYQPYQYQSMHNPALYASHGYHDYYNYESLQPELDVSIADQTMPLLDQLEEQLEEETLLPFADHGEFVNYVIGLIEDIAGLFDDVNIESSSMDVFQNLMTRTYEGNANKDEGCDTCVVCQEEYENNETIATLQCGHEYHVDCINRWTSTKTSCPICRAKV